MTVAMEARVYKWLKRKGAYEQIGRYVFTSSIAREDVASILREVLECAPDGEYPVELYDGSGKFLEDFVVILIKR